MKLIPLSGKSGHGKFAQVDDEDFEYLNQFTWRLLDSQYAIRTSRKKTILMHREINKTPDGFDTDHRDGYGLNNQRYNLRNATEAQNSINQKTQIRMKSSKYKGVSWVKRRSKWIVFINTNKRSIFLGHFSSDQEIAAALAYDAAAIKLFGEFARLNFPPVCI